MVFFLSLASLALLSLGNTSEVLGSTALDAEAFFQKLPTNMSIACKNYLRNIYPEDIRKMNGLPGAGWPYPLTSSFIVTLKPFANSTSISDVMSLPFMPGAKKYTEFGKDPQRGFGASLSYEQVCRLIRLPVVSLNSSQSSILCLSCLIHRPCS